MAPKSSFFGIKRMLAVLKVSVRQPLLKQQLAYRRRGLRKTGQNRKINLPLRPSMPAADFLFAFLKASSSSKRVRGDSNFSCSSLVKMLSLTKGCAIISGPKKDSMHPERLSGSVEGLVYSCS